MNRNRARFVLSCSQKLWHNLIGWRCTIDEEQIQVFDPLLCEFILFILRLIQADDESNP